MAASSVAENRRGVKRPDIPASIRLMIALQCVVMAMRPGTKIPIEKWAYLAYRDANQVRRDWRRFGECAAGVATGPSGLVVIDLDGADGLANWRKLSEGQPRSSTMRLTTPNGVQGIYACPRGVRFKTQAGQLAPGVDVRAWGGLIKVYDPTEPERQLFGAREPAPLPPWLADVLPRTGESPLGRTGGQRVSGSLGRMLARADGSQHDCLLQVMLEAQRRYPTDTAIAVVYELAQLLKLERPGEPWTWRDIEGLVKPGVIPDGTDDELAGIAEGMAAARAAR